MAKFKFQPFDKQAVSPQAQLLVTLRKEGALALSRPAVSALGNAEAVEILYDSEARVIGLRRVDPNARSACRIHVSSTNRGHRVHVQRLCSYFGIDTSKNLRYAAVMDEGVLVIQLDEPLGETSPHSR